VTIRPAPAPLRNLAQELRNLGVQLQERDMEFVELGVDGNAGFALLGENIQEGEAQFVTVNSDAPIGSPAWNDAARVAATAALDALKARICDRELFYCLGRSHPDYRPNLNTGKPWSEMDLSDLRHSLERGTSVPEIADFLCRDPEEVWQKMNELKTRLLGYLN
jgi:hypothetical protein